LVKHKRSCSSASADPSSTESIEEISRIDSSLLEGPNMVKLIEKNDYFHYTTGQIRKRIDPWQDDEEERTPSATRDIKCLLVKEFILYYDNQNIKVFDSSARGKDEYCGPQQLSRIISLELTGLKNPYFLLLQEMFSFRGISFIDAYLSDTSETTWRSYKSEWNTFVKFLIEQRYTHIDWENREICNKIYLEFLNWAFVGKHIPPTSINITCSAISKFICAFIPDFNFAESKLVKNIEKGFMTRNPRKPKYPVMWNPDLLINYYFENNENNLPVEQKYQFLQTKIAILLCYLHMLRPQEAWSCELTDKPELRLEFNKGCWLRTVVKNNKTGISDIWIPNIDLMISQEVKDNDVDQKDTDNQITNPLNMFYAIHILKTMMILPNTKRLFFNRITGIPIPLSTYTSLMHKEMQKMGIPPFFTVYSLKHATIEKLVRLGMELPKINKSARFFGSP
jgi:hypothetical protein